MRLSISAIRQQIARAGNRLRALAIGAILCLAAQPAMAMSADVVATTEAGFGRIVISFKDRAMLPQYVSSVTNSVLVLQFSDQIDVKLDRLAIDLPQYLTVARRDPDGRAIRVALQRQVRVNTMEAGEKLFVDLLPPTWKGPPPSLPDSVIRDLARRADEALKAARAMDASKFGVKILPKVDFKIGRLPTFTRFSFGWNVPFDTQMSRDGATVRITFNRLSAIDLNPLLVDPPPGLKEVQADDANDRLTLVLTVEPNADVRGFRDDQTYVVDLSMPGATVPKPAAKAPAMTEAPPGPEGAKEQVNLPGAHAAAAAEPSEPVAKMVQAPLPVETPPAPPPAAKAEAPASDAKAAVPPEDQALVSPSDADGAPSGEIPPDADRPKVAQSIVRAEAKRIGHVVRVSFPFKDAVASAAFKRVNSLFVVFDTKLPIDVKSLRAVLGAQARDVKVDTLAEGQVVRIDLSDPQLTTLGADGNNWILSIGELVLEPARPLKMERVMRPDGRGLVKIGLTNGGKVHSFVDPAVGDKIMVVTAMAPARGILKPMAFAEVEALASAHGIALLPRVDDIVIATEPSGVTITRDEGLSLSAGQAADGDLSIPKAEKKSRKVSIEGNGFITHDPGEFAMRHRQLMDAVINAPEQQRLAARLQLAQFYLAHRFAPEAMASLRRASEEDPAVTRDPGFIVLYAAAQALNGRDEAARQALNKAELSENPDAAFWRTIVSAESGKWDEAKASIDKAQVAIQSYPQDIQAMYRLAAAQTDIELNDFNAAQTQLASIDSTEVEPAMVARLEMLQGRVADAAGRPDDALERYKRSREQGNRQVSAEAEYRELRQLVRDSKIEDKDAIARLQTLAFAWRGDETELKTLRFLAQMQAKTGDWRGAFSSMRSAIMVGPEAESTRLLQDEMGEEFTSLFLDGKADALDPLEALTLYYDFRDLMPIGPMGDEIVRKLADRLVAVDLLDQASELLSYQVDNRLKGAARAQIAADLAVIHLIDRKPDRALAVLNKTRQSGISASVDRQRRIVEARALADLGRTDLAVELAKNLQGSDVERLRADILWKAKRWGDAGERLEVMLAGRWNDASPLDDQERQDVLRAAVSYALANDQMALDRFRTKFQEKMSASPSARAFDVVTQPIQSMGPEFRDMAKRMAAVDTLRGFVDEYRTQYLKTKPEPSAEAPDPKAATSKAAPPPAAGKEPPPAGAKPAAAPEASAEPAKKVAMADPPPAPGAKPAAPAKPEDAPAAKAAAAPAKPEATPAAKPAAAAPAKPEDPPAAKAAAEAAKAAAEPAKPAH